MTRNDYFCSVYRLFNNEKFQPNAKETLFHKFVFTQ